MALLFQAVLLYHLDFRLIRRLSMAEAPGVLFGMAALACLFRGVAILFPQNRFARTCCNLVLFCFLGLTASFLYQNRFILDYAALVENIGLARSRGVYNFVMASLHPKFMALTLAMIAGYLTLELTGRVRPHRFPWEMRVWRLAALSMVYGIYLASPVPKHDDAAGFIASAAQYHFQNQYRTVPDEAMEYPFVRDGASFLSSPSQEAGPYPPVFLIVMESFCGRYVEARDSAGRYYTPYFNRLIPQGVYVEDFYSNSMQTAKGQFAVLFSLAPSMRGKVFVHYPDVRFDSLASVLKRRGYQTLFFQAYENPDFDNTRDMLLANGFDDFRVLKDFLKPEDEPFDWGWGPEDAVVHRRLFEYLDSGEPERAGPVFVVEATINAHRCEHVPMDKRFLYPHPSIPWEAQANAVHLADRQLEVFFRELEKRPRYKDAIVVITGDHGVNLGTESAAGAVQNTNEDIFKVPLLILQPGRLFPQRIEGEPFSQMDIAPTLLDMIHIHEPETHFQGRSLFQADGSNRALLVQPYGGRSLCSVRKGFKYVYKEQSNEVRAFQLKTSSGAPLEVPLQSLPEDLLHAFDNDIKCLYLNQKLIVQNRILPPLH